MTSTALAQPVLSSSTRSNGRRYIQRTARLSAAAAPPAARVGRGAPAAVELESSLSGKWQ